MSSAGKAALLASAASLAAALAGLSAEAQSRGLADVDPWGVGYLSEGERALPTGLWKASRTEDLLALLRDVRTRDLTPAERILLRRVALSPAVPPAGEVAGRALAERARLMYALGEAEAAADLMTKLPEAPRGLDPLALSADLQLALGNERTACAPVASPSESDGESGYFRRLRAVCAALAGRTSEAELALEVAARSGPVDDWLLDAVLALTTQQSLVGLASDAEASDENADADGTEAEGEDAPDGAADDGRPDARFDSGMNIALSEAAGLPAGDRLTLSSRADLAAAIARREGLPARVRAQAAGIAAEAGLISGEAHRAVFTALQSAEDYRPVSPLDAAVAAFADPAAEADGRARLAASALRSAQGSAARFAAVSRLLEPGLNGLPRNAESVRYAPLFARAALSAENPRAAARWNAAGVSVEGAAPPDAFETAMLDAALVMAGGDRSPASVEAAGLALAEHAQSGSERAAAARALALWAPFGLTVPPEARALMRDAPARGSRNSWEALSAAAAADAGAAGEAVLLLLAATAGKPDEAPAAEMATLIGVARELGAEDAARQLAVEALGVWSSDFAD